MNISLVMFTADGSRRDFPVTKSRVVVGRKNNCDLRIPLSSVSRQHCELRQEDDQLKLRDLGSSNGTYHNNTRIQEVALSAGDEVVIGPVVFTVVIDGYPLEIKPVRTIVGNGSESEEAHSEPVQSAAGDASPAQSEAVEAGDAHGHQTISGAAESQSEDEGDEFAFPSLADDSEEGGESSGSEDEPMYDDPIAALEAMAGQGDGDESEEAPDEQAGEQEESQQGGSSRRQ